MNFPTYIDLISRSAPADWNVQSGPLFLEPVFGAAQPGSRTNVHQFNMAYWPNLSITMAYGMVCSEDVRHDWANNFPDPKAASHYVDFFFNSALVFRDVVVAVDGGQGILPLPNPGPTSPYEVPRRRRDIARLIHQLTNPARDFDEYFSQARFKAIEEVWPL
ncbi:MAG: hypothetical protein HUU21_23625 [Polyangiaceae bacterium]|nr:hypothetical protein [Polyangiaceae bacterium]